MFLRVAAVYERDNPNNKFKLAMSAAHKKAEEKECLGIFEKDTLPDIIDILTDGEIYVDSTLNPAQTKADYYIYAIYHSAYKMEKSDKVVKEHICVMVTDRKMYEKKENGQWADIGEKEFRMLLVNINHVYVRGDALKVTLEKIINEPLNHLAREIHIQRLLDDVEKTKRLLIDEVIPNVTKRGELIEELEEKSIKLSEASTLFGESANKLKAKSGCCGGWMPDTSSLPDMPHIPFINPAPLLKK